ncbi:MAG: hypothetical protein DBX37_05640 [Massilioclostridium sp.]|nr:MAG: hypothetical protein DBX37_05640 [Massilioclostridium sp.]
MNCVVILFFLEIILFIGAMTTFKCDFFSPSVIVCFVFMVSTFVLLTNYENWGVFISIKTASLIILALLVFIFAGIIVSKTENQEKFILKGEVETISISNWKLILSFVFETLVCILYYKEVVRIASYATQDWGMGLIWRYRQVAFYTDSLSREQMMSNWVTQGNKIVMIMAYLMLYVFLNNVVINKQKILHNIKYLLLIPAYIFTTLLSGNRLALMIMVFFAIIVWYMLQTIKVGMSIKRSFSYIFKFVGIAILIIVLFWLSTSVVQRYTKFPFWETISIYAGAPIQLLEDYINNPVASNVVLGQESFTNLYNSLYKLGLSDYHGIINLEYRTYNGISLGNVYTTLRRFIQDFGYIGMLISVLLISIFYNWFYYRKLRRIRKINYRTSMQIIVYAFISYPLFLFSIEEYFTIMWTPGYLVSLILFYLLFMFYTRITFHNGVIKIRRW